MLKYKNIIPIALVAMLGLSIWQTSKNNIGTNREYEKQLALAREAAQYEILVDAKVYYENALKIKPTLDIYLEYLNMYVSVEKYDDAEEVGKKMVSKYSDNSDAYAALGKVYYLSEEYSDLYKLYGRYKNKGLYSDKLEELYKEVEYLYSLSSEYMDAGGFSGGRCSVQTEEGWGFVSESGNKIGSHAYVWVGTYGDGIAPILDENNEYYFIDADGNKKKVLNKIASVKGIGTVSGSIIPVYDGESWSYYDLEQNLICGGFDEASAMGNGYAAVKKDGRWYIINSAGERINDVSYSDVIMDEKGIVYRGCFFAKESVTYHMYDAEGNIIGDQEFQDADLFNVIEGADCLAAVKQNGKWGFVNMQGEVVIEPKYDDALSFKLGLAGVRMGNKWGYIDINEEVVIAADFLAVRDFNDSGNAFVNLGESWRLLKLKKYED